MKTMSRLMLGGGMLALTLTISASIAAGQSDRKPDKPSGSTATQPNAPASAKPAEPGSVTQPGRETKDRLDQEGLDASDSETQVVRKILLEETKHRKRAAAIKRLRELATEQGNEQRLQALDKLEAKLNTLYERKTARWKERLGKAKFGRLQDHLNKGKGKGKGAGRGKAGGPSTDKNRAESGDVSSAPGKGKPDKDQQGQMGQDPSGAGKGKPQSGETGDKGKGQPGAEKGKGGPGAEKDRGEPGEDKGKGPGKGNPKGQKGGQ